MKHELLKTATNRRRNVKDALAFADDIENQLRMAGLVQRDFLPKQLPACDKLQWSTIFEPIEWVSGDIYDIVRLDEKHIGFYVADVVGHGVPAALLTTFLKQALVMRSTMGNTYKIFEPSEVMSNLNLRLFEQRLSGSQFITCCYCLLNIETLELRYARAGHPYPILIRDVQAPQPLESRGSLLGIFENAEFEQNTIQLHGHDKLIIYSDGIDPFVGDCKADGQFHFSESFHQAAALPITGIIEKIESYIQADKPDSATNDDVTVVGLEIL